MPVKNVGKDCYKYGKKGKKYCGGGAKTRAAKQGRAIESPKARRGNSRGG